MKINVTKPSIPPYEEFCTEIKDVWNNHVLTNAGPKHQLLERKLESFLDVKHTVLFANGHLALEAALALFSFPEGSEIITTPFTFVSTVNAIVRNRLTPVFCDINRNDYTLDVNQIEKLITKRTVAIMAVHVYGMVCDVERIEVIAKKYSLKVIYDAAHAFGVKYMGRNVASFGDLTMFSFHATKVFNCIEGGCLCFNDDSYLDFLTDYKNFGLRGEDCHCFGGNAKMNEIEAVMGLCNLRHISEYIENRKRVYNLYCERLGGIPGIRLLTINSKMQPNFAYYPVVFDGYKYTRDEIMANLSKEGIGTRKYFYPSINEMFCYKGKFVGETPISHAVSCSVLSLPLYPDLSNEEVNAICDIILR